MTRTRVAMFAARSRWVFNYPAEISDWHDGDTCYVHRVSQPGLTIHGEHVRVEGINAPELNTAAGVAARTFARTLCPAGTIVSLVVTNEDKYGRLLARVMFDGGDFGEAMIKAGHAVEYKV